MASGVAVNGTKKNMAPGKTHLKDSKLKGKFQLKKGNNSRVKKAKNSNLPKKKLKERTLEQIEKVNKNFTDVHNVLIKDKSQVANSKCVSAEKQTSSQITDKKPTPSVSYLSKEELSRTLENIANL